MINFLIYNQIKKEIKLSFSIKRKINFYETDAQGVVHHSNYPRYFEEFRGEFLERLGLPYHKVREDLKTDIVLLTLYVKYKKPIKFGEVIRIEGDIKIKNKYFFSFDYKIFVGNDLRTEGKTEHCCISITNGKIISIPKEILERVGGVKK